MIDVLIKAILKRSKMIFCNVVDSLNTVALMRYTTSLVLASAFVLATSGTAGAQIVGVYVGPQISGLGIGVSAQAKLTQLSVS